jgi:hypothetical protein
MPLIYPTEGPALQALIDGEHQHLRTGFPFAWGDRQKQVFIVG